MSLCLEARVPRRLFAVLIALCVALPALAHPMTRDAWSLRTAVQLAGETLDVVVVLEVPFDVVTSDLKADLDAARTSADASKAAQAVLDRYTQKHFDTMAAGLSLTIDGKKVAGAWKPRKNRLNGKGAVTGGFFMYIVEFVPAAPPAFGREVRVVVHNGGYTEPKMVYSAMVVSGVGWTVAEDSSKSLLPDKPYDLNGPEFWVSDAALRKVSARYTRTP